MHALRCTDFFGSRKFTDAVEAFLEKACQNEHQNAE